MLLVMETTGLFNKDQSDIKFSQLYVITKDRIESFLPGLWDDLFKMTKSQKNIKEEQLEQETTIKGDVGMDINNITEPSQPNIEQPISQSPIPIETNVSSSSSPPPPIIDSINNNDQQQLKVC
jgi:hypothetical protein